MMNQLKKIIKLKIKYINKILTNKSYKKNIINWKINIIPLKIIYNNNKIKYNYRLNIKIKANFLLIFFWIFNIMKIQEY